jgi:hypothetical protein
MNVENVRNQLKDNPDNIIKILLKLGFEEESIILVDRQNLLKMPRPNGDNPAGILIYYDSLKVIGTTDSSYTGDIFTLVMNIRDYSFYNAINKIIRWLNLKDVPIHYPFGGFYKQIYCGDNKSETELTEYPLEVLPPPKNYSKRFLDDGIAIDSQDKFGVRYSFEDDAILIPIYDMKHRLVGVKARNNNDDDYNRRWYAWLPYAKTQIVYGLELNYAHIIRKRTLIIFESEKAVMQCDTMGLHCCVAVAGHNISYDQAEMIKSLMVDTIIIAFDEGIIEEELEFECKKLKMNTSLYTNRVYYLLDKDNEYLTEGSKDSPSDHGQELLMNMIKRCKYEYKI